MNNDRRRGGVYLLPGSDDVATFVMAVGPVDTDDLLWHGVPVEITIRPREGVVFDPTTLIEVGFLHHELNEAKIEADGN